jgi:hypothetical protein
MKYTTMCLIEAIARVQILEDREVNAEQYLTLHSMITTLYILKNLGFKRVQLEEYNAPIYP